MLDTPDIGHGSRTDQHTGNPELSPHRQFSCREGMFDTSYCRFNRSPQIAPFFLMCQAFPPPLRGMSQSLGETQMVALIPFPWTGWALGSLVEGAALTNIRFEVGDKAFVLAARMNWHVLLLGTSDLHRFAILVQLDLEIRQVELACSGSAPPNGRLEVFNMLFL